MGKFDEIFDDVVVNAKAAAAVVSKKASTVYDTSKHKITAAEIRGEINKKLRDIGKYTYKKEVFGVDTSAEIAQLVADVKELKENLDIINAHIDSVKNQKKCPQCEAKIPRNSIYCNICGAKLEDDEPVTAEKAEAPAAVQTVEEAADAAAEAVTETAE
ncbi:zinc ribbon domain-containing protein [Ruminococcus sp.]|uniref:zinc ribbon domain-containing protein n=1 Tax=Ruminococcus sp. TaxID=41978 RepID=UPI002E782049|nr:zinc ribbon domain-containing protein [Ruminococcus sp.]MEE1263618.1 zinc ribbon domain-containing protein [Ruminococcus sp.]